MATLSKQSALSKMIGYLASHGWSLADSTLTVNAILDTDSQWMVFVNGEDRAGVLIVVDCEPDEIIADYTDKPCFTAILEPFMDSI